MLASSILCAATAHCIQLTDGSDLPKAWGTAERVHDDDNATAPELSGDASGNAVVVWSQPDGIWSSRYTPNDGWTAAAPLQQGGPELGTARLAMTANGIAFAVWPLFWVRGNILASQSGPSGSWGPSQRIDDDSGEAFEPQISSSADGSAIVVWSQYDGTRDDIWSNRYTRADGWSFAQRIETNNAGSASRPQVAMDSSGHAIAVWQQSDGTRTDMWSNRYTANSGWSAARPIENDDAGQASQAQVAMDPSGRAVVVWRQSDGTRSNIWSNRYTSAGWGAAERIESRDRGDALNPQVAVDANGDAVAVWARQEGTRTIWSNRYVEGRGWGTAERIDADDAADAREPRVAVDPNGNAVSVWRQSGDGSDSIWSNRYTLGSGWGVPRPIDSAHDGITSDARVAIDANGSAIAVWSESISESAGIWSNRLE